MKAGSGKPGVCHFLRLLHILVLPGIPQEPDFPLPILIMSSHYASQKTSAPNSLDFSPIERGPGSHDETPQPSNDVQTKTDFHRTLLQLSEMTKRAIAQVRLEIYRKPWSDNLKPLFQRACARMRETRDLSDNLSQEPGSGWGNPMTELEARGNYAALLAMTAQAIQSSLNIFPTRDEAGEEHGHLTDDRMSELKSNIASLNDSVAKHSESNLTRLTSLVPNGQ